MPLYTNTSWSKNETPVRSKKFSQWNLKVGNAMYGIVQGMSDQFAPIGVMKNSNRHFDKVFFYDSGVAGFIDRWIDRTNAVRDDNVTPPSPDINSWLLDDDDYIYMGYNAPFRSIYYEMGTQPTWNGGAQATRTTFEYYSPLWKDWGTGWGTLAEASGTQDFTAASGTIEFDTTENPPESSWSAASLDEIFKGSLSAGDSISPEMLYWIRIKMNFPFTVAPKFDELKVGASGSGLPGSLEVLQNLGTLQNTVRLKDYLDQCSSR